MRWLAREADLATHPAPPQLRRLTVLDFLDNFFVSRRSTRRSLSHREAEDFFELLDGFYAGVEPPPLVEHEVRLLPDTRQRRGVVLLPATAVTLRDDHIAAVDEDYEGDGAAAALTRRLYTGAFLYADRVVDYDPISFLPHLFTADESLHLSHVLRLSRRYLEVVRPLVETGVLLLAPISTPEETGRAYDVAETAAAAAGVPSSMELSAAFDAMNVCYRWGASYMSLIPRIWPDIEKTIGHVLPEELDTDIKVATALTTVDLPTFRGLDATKLVQLRESEDAFYEWRAMLRGAARVIGDLTAPSTFDQDAREVFDDLLRPAAAAAARATSRSAALRSALRDQPLRSAFGTALGTGAAPALACRSKVQWPRQSQEGWETRLRPWHADRDSQAAPRY